MYKINRKGGGLKIVYYKKDFTFYTLYRDRVCYRERFLDPRLPPGPPFNFVNDFRKIIFVYFLFRVTLG